MVIYFIESFHFESTKAVPWNYGATTYIGHKPLMLEPNVTNTAGIGGIKQSSRVLALEKPQRKTFETSKGSEISSPNSESGPSKKTVPKEETGEFLKVTKKSDYMVVDQLSQTPSKISMIYLFLSS